MPNCLLYASDVIIGISCFLIRDITFSDIVNLIDILDGHPDVDRAYRWVVLIAKYLNDSFQTFHSTTHPRDILPIQKHPCQTNNKGWNLFSKIFYGIEKIDVSLNT